MLRTKWTERKFNFDLPAEWLSNILERLRGTSTRMQEVIAFLSEEQMNFKPDNKWSIKEHIGHLADLEELHEGRIDDFISRKTILRAADMNNAKTYQANHNSQLTAELIKSFTTKRNHFVKRFETMDDETQKFKSLHPRLQVMMRPVDMAYFTAEHDDHHLANIREIIETYQVLKTW